MSYKKASIGLGLILFFGASVLIASAEHSWNGFHWARTANPFTLKLGDNVSPAWDRYLATTTIDWDASSVLNAVVTAGNTNPRVCKATTGRVEVCSYRYGFNSWLGVAQVWVSGMHIVKATTKVNDSYFNTSAYNTPAWRSLVMCQEVGHTLGLNHQDEIFDNPNLGTCMDYTNDPSTNQHPNQHDYDQLEAMYAHLDSVNTVFVSRGEHAGLLVGKDANDKLSDTDQNTDVDDPSAWGQAIQRDAHGKNSVYMRYLDGNEKLFTFVVWAQQ